MADSYTGEIRLFAYGRAPAHWAPCDGRTLQISQYLNLFKLIRNIYGGDGQTTFKLPDLRGRITMHQDGAAFPVGTVGGETAHVLTQAEMPVPHTHVAQANSAAATKNVPNGLVLAATSVNAYATGTAQPLAQHTITEVGGQAHENMAPYLGLMFCISLDASTPTPP